MSLPGRMTPFYFCSLDFQGFSHCLLKCIPPLVSYIFQIPGIFSNPSPCIFSRLSGGITRILILLSLDEVNCEYQQPANMKIQH